MSRAQQQLVRCAEEGNNTGVEAAVQAGASVDWVDTRGWAALHHAVSADNSEMVNLLLAYSADPDIRSMVLGEEGATPLHMAACFGNTDVMKILLDGGADGAATDHRGKTAVHWAALQGKIESLRLLETYRCDLKARVNGRGTVLHYAAAFGDLEVVEWLVERGVDITVKDKNGGLAKDVAKRKSHKHVYHFLKEAERQPRGSTGRARKPDLTDHPSLSQAIARRDTHRENTEAPRRESTAKERTRPLGFTPSRAPDSPAASKKKTWIIHSMSVGSKSGLKLRLQKMQREMEEMENIIRSKDVHITRLQGDIFATELEKVRVEEELKEMRTQSRQSGRPTEKHQNSSQEGPSDVPHAELETLLQEKAAILHELEEVKARLEEEQRARVCERRKSDSKIASLTSELEEATQKMRKSGVRRKNLLRRNETFETDLTAAGTPSGLPDLGDAGSMNSVIQCLYSVADLREYLTSDAYRRDLASRGETAPAMAGVFKALKSGVQPEILAKVRRLQELVSSSEDAPHRGMDYTHDLLTFILTRLHRDLCQGDGTSVVSQLFFGSQECRIVCRWTGINLSQVSEDFSVISVNTAQRKQNILQYLLKDQYQSQNIEQDCPYCVRRHLCRKQISIIRLPLILIIHLASKDQEVTVTYPSSTFKMQDITSCSGASYELFGVLALRGKVASPKYIAHCRSPPGTIWNVYDDEKVHNVSIRDVLDQPNVHLLFYSTKRN